MLLHYLVKVESPKMHVNTTSAFNVNYKLELWANAQRDGRPAV